MVVTYWVVSLSGRAEGVRVDFSVSSAARWPACARRLMRSSSLVLRRSVVTVLCRFSCFGFVRPRCAATVSLVALKTAAREHVGPMASMSARRDSGRSAGVDAALAVLFVARASSKAWAAAAASGWRPAEPLGCVDVAAVGREVSVGTIEGCVTLALAAVGPAGSLRASAASASTARTHSLTMVASRAGQPSAPVGISCSLSLPFLADDASAATLGRSSVILIRIDRW